MNNIYFCKPEEVPLSHLPEISKNVFLTSGTFNNIQQIATVILNKDIDEHIHKDMMEIFYIIRGEVKVISSNIEKTLNGGDAFIVPPNVKHALKILQEAELFYISLI